MNSKWHPLDQLPRIQSIQPPVVILANTENALAVRAPEEARAALAAAIPPPTVVDTPKPLDQPVQPCPLGATHYVEFSLHLDTGEACDGELYDLIAPNGKKSFGKLDPQGFTRVANLPGGMATVIFPRLNLIETTRAASATAAGKPYVLKSKVTVAMDARHDFYVVGKQKPLPQPKAAPKPAVKVLSQDEEDMKLGENYLSADYRRINPMLAALEVLKYPNAQIRDPAFDPSAKIAELVPHWKRIALERKYVDAQGAESWDADSFNDTLTLFKRINRVWNKFSTPPGALVFRGDSAVLYTSYAFLDPKASTYADGEVALNKTIEWAGIMSTTLADPRFHNFIAEKTIIWKITLPAVHQGRCLGSNNPSEAEVTFPVGSKVKIEKLLVRVNDKTLEQADFGNKATVIIFAKML